MTGEFDPPITTVRDVVARALAEDLGTLGDLTSIAVIADEATGSGRFMARRDGVLAGVAVATEVFRQLDPAVEVAFERTDGEDLCAGAAFGTVSGPLRPILCGERTALNFLQHASGIATVTRRYVRAAHGRSRIRDTRKTLPGLRALEKAAVRAGGGFNHRDGLSDAVLIKDNHLVKVDLPRAVERARARWPGRIVQVECDTAEQVDAALQVGADIVLLDNMDPAAVASMKTKVGDNMLLEVSGGITLDDVAAFAEAGADFISVGTLTHSAPALDLALDLD